MEKGGFGDFPELRAGVPARAEIRRRACRRPYGITGHRPRTVPRARCAVLLERADGNYVVPIVPSDDVE